MSRIPLVAALVTLVLPALAQAQLQVTSTAPALNANAAVGSVVAVTFDRPLDTGTVDFDSFRVFGQRSGPARGTFAFSNGNQTVTLTPDAPFSAGEFVVVTLSHDLRGADASALRAAGYSWQFMIATTPSAGVFVEIDRFSNRSGPGNTRIYGAAATDFDNDEYVDLATVNEDSADVRVFMNLADGSGLFGPMLPREPIGQESSPNASADFDNDGRADLVAAAAHPTANSISILRGLGDGTFAPAQTLAAGNAPHGIVNIDVDGDGDDDIVNANVDSNAMSLFVNDGTGVFTGPTFFEGGVNGEYGLANADMNGDGIQDLVVAGRNGGEIRTLLGNGNGTFTPAGSGPVPCGGSVWVVVLGDVNGDGELDAVTANDGSGNVGVLTGNGDGTFDPVTTISIGSHLPSVDLGDLDGDGDLDMVVSSFGGGFWRRYENDGSGTFSFVEDIEAEDSPSCSVLLDADNDGDLDMALTDELADVIILKQNTGSVSSPCSPTPSACRAPLAAKKSKIAFKDKSPDTSDGLVWSWGAGPVTTRAELGDPLATDDYVLCLYDDGALVKGWNIPAGGLCNGKPCWKDLGKGVSYSDKLRTPDGIQTAKLLEGLLPGKAKMTVKGKGPLLGLPDLAALSGILDVQLQNTGGGPCFGATYPPPYLKQDATQLKAVSALGVVTTTTTTTTTTTSTTLSPLWLVIHAQVIGPRCGGCHGPGAGSGGLAGLDDCDTAHTNLVGVASVELPTMSRVEAGDPTISWMMHKLDGTHSGFTAQCTGGFCGSRMPLGGPFLSTAELDGIRTWISNGAVNDCW